MTTAGCYGQDWASYQSPAPDITGLSFVFVKSTEGLTYINPRWAAQTAYARLHKLTVGHYHYPHMANSPAAEADAFLAAAQPQAGDVLVLDWEGYDAANKGVPMAHQIAYKNAWLSRVRGAMPQHQVGTYCNASYLADDPKGAYGDFLWIATGNRPAGQPGISHDWLFHQYAAGSVDKDYCSLSAADLAAWAHAKENDVPLTAADANTLLSVQLDNPTTTDNSKIALGALLWDAGKNAFQANNAVQQLKKDVETLKTAGVDLDALAAKVADLLSKRLQS